MALGLPSLRAAVDKGSGGGGKQQQKKGAQQPAAKKAKVKREFVEDERPTRHSSRLQEAKAGGPKAAPELRE